MNNKIKLEFLSLSINESLARTTVGIFSLALNPSLSELSDIKTAVSEAVTNCIVHGYPKDVGIISMECEIIKDVLHINIVDKGVGIKDVNLALESFYTTKGEEERSGMGFTIMKSFMDDVKVSSEYGEGTNIYMCKKIKTDA